MYLQELLPFYFYSAAYVTDMHLKVNRSEWAIASVKEITSEHRNLSGLLEKPYTVQYSAMLNGKFSSEEVVLRLLQSKCLPNSLHSTDVCSLYSRDRD